MLVHGSVSEFQSSSLGSVRFPRPVIATGGTVTKATMGRHLGSHSWLLSRAVPDWLMVVGSQPNYPWEGLCLTPRVQGLGLRPPAVWQSSPRAILSWLRVVILTSYWLNLIMGLFNEKNDYTLGSKLNNMMYLFKFAFWASKRVLSSEIWTPDALERWRSWCNLGKTLSNLNNETISLGPMFSINLSSSTKRLHTI